MESASFGSCGKKCCREQVSAFESQRSKSAEMQKQEPQRNPILQREADACELSIEFQKEALRNGQTPMKWAR